MQLRHTVVQRGQSGVMCHIWGQYRERRCMPYHDNHAMLPLLLMHDPERKMNGGGSGRRREKE